ncbi:MAG TPA: glycoside hydrolase family 3 N-terminal domain-containing protein [Gaiellaceae bacterium]|nr:glycoside hydrolase family 3 N-terminal domain-containing protein [Gaiellaceae bacterium]
MRSLAAVCAGLVGATLLASSSPAHAAPTTARMIGQKLVVSMDGATPSASLLGRARRGKIGGVLVHRSNFGSAAQLRAVTRRLRRAAAAGGRPGLLIAVDQEGGPVKTVPWIPPTLSPPQMGARGSSRSARRQGRRTGSALRDLGINTDFAPVADVPTSSSSFMYLQGRTWSVGAPKTARLANAFALGLADRNTLATMKHFPGLGFAKRDTDTSVVRIAATRARLAPGLRPYRRAVANHVPLVMLSNAVYRAYDRRHAAAWSRAIGIGLLRRTLGFRGVTITDALDGAAAARGTSPSRLAVRAAAAGTDMILLSGSEASSRRVYRSLVDAASAGRIRTARLRVSYERILALKQGP